MQGMASLDSWNLGICKTFEYSNTPPVSVWDESMRNISSQVLPLYN